MDLEPCCVVLLRYPSRFEMRKLQVRSSFLRLIAPQYRVMLACLSFLSSYTKRQTNCCQNTQCSVAQTSVIINAPPPSSQPLERYVFSTNSFPRIPASETLTTFVSNSPLNERTNSNSDTDPPDAANHPIVAEANKQRFAPPPTSDLPEQFRATLARLSMSLGNLKTLPEDCSFTLAVELRDEEDVDPPIGREDSWIAAQPGLQKESNRKNSGGGEQFTKQGRTVPVRNLEAGAFRMEVWVEEAKGKFQASVEEEEEGGK